MKIGIDLDGVVFDSEQLFRVNEEIFDIDELKGNNLINREEPKIDGRYNWTEEARQKFTKDYFLSTSMECTIMPGFKTVYQKLRELGHEFVVITARGEKIKEMAEDAKRILKENDIEFDKYYFGFSDKLEICQKENIELMIDDDWRIVKKISENNIKTLYFRDTNLMKLEENEYLKEVNNWGDIYRVMKNM